MAWDARRNRVVLFGGITSPLDAPDAAQSATNSTWEYKTETVPGLIPLTGVAVSPNLISSAAGGTVTLSLTLAAPAPAEGNLVLLHYSSDAGIAALGRLGFYGGVVVRGATMDVTMSVIPPNALAPQGITIEALSGGASFTTFLKISP
jgi:hypothetical protein